MIRRLISCALTVAAFVVVAVGFLAWQTSVPAASAPRLQGKLHSSALVVDGRRRTFTFYVPPRLPRRPQLLLVLHGSTKNGKQMRADTAYAFDEIADRKGFLVAYPNGYRGHWNDCRAVGDYEAKRLAVNDVTFLREMTAWFERKYKIAADQVFAVGVSNGGQMSYRLALEAPELVRGIAAIAANLPTADNQTCLPSGRPVATMIVNGTDDPLNPHEGGRAALYGLFFRRGNVQSTLATAAYWTNLARHSGPAAKTALPDTDPTDGTSVTQHLWSSDTKPAVGLLIVKRGGHTIPHPEARFPRLLGRTCRDISSPQLIWEFFANETARLRPAANG
jgi:polyhydroxybutyrate depolymerase